MWSFNETDKKSRFTYSMKYHISIEDKFIKRNIDENIPGKRTLENKQQFISELKFVADKNESK